MVAVLVAALTACTPETQVDSTGATAIPVGPTTQVTGAEGCPAEGLPPLLLAGGKDSLNAELRQYDLCNAAGTRIGELGRYSALSAVGEHVAVANAAAGPDRISLLQDEELVPLGMAGMVPGVTPSVDETGRVAFMQGTDDFDAPFAVAVWSPDGSGTRVLTKSARPTTPIVFGGNGELAVVQNSDELLPGAGAPTMTVYDAATGAALREAQLPLGVVRGAAWDASTPYIALTGGADEPGVLLEAKDLAVARPIPAGYRALAFTPNGDQLLLGASGGRLALLDARPVDAAAGLQLLPKFPDGEVVAADWR